jgi:ferritin-like metal-binding protein YciE
MELQTLKDLYIKELKDLYSAEKQIIKALPKMVKAACNERLASGFEEHLAQTKEHAVRLDQILKSHASPLAVQSAKAWKASSRKARK